MSSSRYQISAGVWADARRALWLEAARTLVIADLHLGYAWVQRQRGQLLPLGDHHVLAARVSALQADYKPSQLVFLGDFVHRATPIPALVQELKDLLETLEDPDSPMTVVAGNHDRDLQALLEAQGISLAVVPSLEAASFHLIHGDEITAPPPAGTRIIMGHEHPAIVVGDGVASAVKCPCFLVSSRLIILPAFSDWAAGTVLGRYPFMSLLAQHTRFEQAIAIMGQRLLPLPLSSSDKNRSG